MIYGLEQIDIDKFNENNGGISLTLYLCLQKAQNTNDNINEFI